jgi:apolipoprotein N-acyltransferase
MALKGANILLVMSNDGWFKDTGAHLQHLRLSQIRAIETRRSIVRAANTGISGHISQRGEIVGLLGWWEEGTLYVEVACNHRITFFSLFGDYIGRTALFFSTLALLNLFVRSLTCYENYQGPGQEIQ